MLRTDLDLLSQDLDHETRAETVAEADKEASRMGRLLEELLQLSAADVALPKIEEARVDLGRLAGEAVNRMRALAGGRDLRAEQPEQPVVIRGDAERLGQVLNNLLDNAIRHTADDGEIVVRVRHDAGGASLSVSDDGVGISAEHLPHIFDRFYRVDRARSRTSGGTGLGLAIARMIAQAHGGSLTVESSPGQGSIFTLRFQL